MINYILLWGSNNDLDKLIFSKSLSISILYASFVYVIRLLDPIRLDLSNFIAHKTNKFVISLLKYFNVSTIIIYFVHDLHIWWC